MANDEKGGPNATPAFPHHGVKIFTYPKSIFIWPTFLAAIISALIMAFSGDITEDPRNDTRSKIAAENSIARDDVTVGEVVSDKEVARSDVVPGTPDASAAPSTSPGCSSCRSSS